MKLTEIQFEPELSNFLDESFSNAIGVGRRKECKARGLKGKAFRECVRKLRKEDKGLSRSERKEKKKQRKEDFEKAIVEGKVEKGKVFRKLQKFNPAAIALRGTVLAALRFNIFGVATRLYPALLTVEEAKAKNFDVDNLPKARLALQKVYAFYTRIGGDPNKMLKNVIIKAHDKPILNTKKAKERKAAEEKKGFDGSDETYSNLAESSIIAISTTSAGVLASIITSVGAKKNPYREGSPQAQKFDVAATEAPPVPAEYSKVIKEAEQGASDDAKKGITSAMTASTDKKVAEQVAKEELGIVDKKILGMPKVVAIGLGVLLLVGGILVAKKLMKNKSGVATT